MATQIYHAGVRATVPSIADEDRRRVGLLGLEATHRWDKKVTLNEPRENGYPRYKLQRIPGLKSLPERDDNRTNRMGQMGEVARPSLVRGKTVSYEGEIEAMNMADLREGESALAWAFGDPRTELEMVVTPHPDYIGGRTMVYRARVMSLDIDEEFGFALTHVPSPYVKPFILGLRLGDPRSYEPTWQRAEADMDAGVATVSVETFGSAPTDPVITVTGPQPKSGWDVLYLDRIIRLEGLELVAGNTATINFSDRTVIRSSDGKEFGNGVRGNWWNEGVYGLDPRTVADVRLEGSGTGSLKVAWRDAYWV